MLILFWNRNRNGEKILKSDVNSARGAISVFVALMMAGILSLGTFVIEAGRLQAARTQLSEATISASSSMLAAYNTDLHERYSLLAIDEERSNGISCLDYINFNSDLSAGYFGNNVTRLYSIDSVSMSGVYNLTYPHILKRQILTTAKYNISPDDSNFNSQSASYVLSELKMKCQYVSDKMTEIHASNGDLNSVSPELRNALRTLDATFADYKKYDDKHNVKISNSSYALLPSVTGTVESVIPDIDETNVNLVIDDATDLLGTSASVLGSTSNAVSETDVNINMGAFSNLGGFHTTSWFGDFTHDELVETIYVGSLSTNFKDLADTINAAINILENDRDGNLLLNSYISQKFSNRRQVTDSYIGPGEESNSSAENITFAKACCEYVFGGSKSEVSNQSEAYEYIMAFRLINNLYDVFKEGSSSQLNITDKFSVAAHFAWAYYETCLDMYMLTEYNTAVPMTKENPILSINNPSAISAAFSSRNPANALKSLGYYNEASAKFVIAGMDKLDYTDSLSLALWFIPNSNKLLRVADLIQLEMRYKEQYVDNKSAGFLMSEQNTYCRVECIAKMNSILPIVSIGGADNSLQNHGLRTVKYSGY